MHRSKSISPIQAQGEYFYFNEAREGQFDLGLVDRIGNFQAGLFSSFKHVDLRQYQNGGTLGQGALTLDYIFRLGKVGVFGTKAFLDNQVIDNRNAGIVNGSVVDSCAGAAPGTCALAPNLFLQRSLRVVDQAGVSGTVGLWKNNYMEGNLGYLRSRANGDRIGGTLRFIFPVGNRVAFTVEGGMNETLVAASNWGRAVVGVQFGNFLRPKEMQAVDHPVPGGCSTCPVRSCHAPRTERSRASDRRCRSRSDRRSGRDGHAQRFCIL